MSRKRDSSNETTIDFLLAGRKVTLPLFVATLVATWYGNILGMGEFIYKGGIVAWVCFALPYYIAALLFAYFIAGKIRKSKVRTIPEQIENAFGKRAAWLSSFIVLVITIPAAYVLMLGVMINLFTGWSLWICIVTGAILSLAYIYTGGFRADVLTNSVQFVLMYIGFGVLLFFTVNSLGPIGTMLDKLPVNHKELSGDYSWQYIISWFIIALQTFIDPGFHQRCAAAKSPKTARRGIAVSVLFWIIFDTMTLITGLYSKAYFITDNPIMAFPMLGDSVLPVVWKGLFTVALLATIMSTLDSYAFISAATIGNDILKPLKRFFRTLERLSTKSLIKTGLVITSIFSIFLAMLIPSAVDLIYKTSSIAIPGLLAPMLFSYSNKIIIKPRIAIIIMLASSGLSFLWTMGKIFFDSIEIFSEIEPMIPGILLSLILAIIFIRKRNEK
ncbi:MAG: sodium:solute symporter family protein [bacterium]